MLTVAEDIFQHHDGIVHHDADQQQQGQQRHDIEGESAEVHNGNGAQQRYRDGDGDDDGGTEGAQEQPDDGGCQQGPCDQVLQQGIDELLNVERIVRGDLDGHAGRQLRPDLGFQPALHFIDDGDGIGVGDFHQPQAHSAVAVEMGKLAEIAQAVLDFGDVF